MVRAKGGGALERGLLAAALAAGGAVAFGLAGCAVPSHYVLGAPEGGSDIVSADTVPGPDGAEGGSVDGGGMDAGDGGGAVDGTVDGGAMDADAGADASWPPSGQAVAIVCTLINSCQGLFYNPNASLAQCIDYAIYNVFRDRAGIVPMMDNDAEERRLYECATMAYSCASLAECLAGGQPTTSCQGPDGSIPAPFCAGNDLISCRTGTPITVHCADWGMQCGTDPEFGSHCYTGRVCDAGEVPHCDGNNYVSCNRGTNFEQSVPCEKDLPGSTCQMVSTNDAAPEPRCVAGGPTCAQANPHCDGNTLVECNPATNTEVRTDCSVLFATTCETQGPTAQCATGTDCTSSTPEVCSSTTTIRTCLNGGYFSINCGSLGLNNCLVSPNYPPQCY